MIKRILSFTLTILLSLSVIGVNIYAHAYEDEIPVETAEWSANETVDGYVYAQTTLDLTTGGTWDIELNDYYFQLYLGFWDIDVTHEVGDYTSTIDFMYGEDVALSLTTIEFSNYYGEDILAEQYQEIVKIDLESLFNYFVPNIYDTGTGDRYTFGDPDTIVFTFYAVESWKGHLASASYLIVSATTTIEMFLLSPVYAIRKTLNTYSYTYEVEGTVFANLSIPFPSDFPTHPNEYLYYEFVGWKVKDKVDTFVSNGDDLTAYANDSYIIDIEPVYKLTSTFGSIEVEDNTPVDIDGLLTYIGFNNTVGKIILYVVTLIITVGLLWFLKLESFIIIIVELLIFGFFIFLGWIPVWMMIILGFIFLTGLMRSLKGGS